MINHLSLFSGYEGFGLGLKLAGLSIRTVGYCEYDKYCQEIIRARVRDGYLDDAPIWPDVRTFPGHLYHGKVDILTGGFPCQPHSVAGKRAGASDERNLWPDTLRIISEARPNWVLLENVPGILVEFAGTVIGELASIGYDAEWGIVSAADVGANHLRKRWWVLGHANKQSAKLESPHGMERITAPSSGGQVPDADGNGRSGRRRATEQERQHDHVGRGQQPGADGEAGEVADAEGRRFQEQWINEPAKSERASLERGSSEVADAFSQRQETGGAKRGIGIQERGASNYSPTVKSCGNRTLGDWWSVEPDVGRVANGVAHRVDRLKTLGNGIVPAVVAEFLRRLA